LNAERVDLDDILEAGRQRFGLETLQDIKHAMLERDGTISIIPATTKHEFK
jgi:uncharacterized membrane protein YcaP (DUF421 family)